MEKLGLLQLTANGQKNTYEPSNDGTTRVRATNNDPKGGTKKD